MHAEPKQRLNSTLKCFKLNRENECVVGKGWSFCFHDFSIIACRQATFRFVLAEIKLVFCLCGFPFCWRSIKSITRTPTETKTNLLIIIEMIFFRFVFVFGEEEKKWRNILAAETTTTKIVNRLYAPWNISQFGIRYANKSDKKMYFYTWMVNRKLK